MNHGLFATPVGAVGLDMRKRYARRRCDSYIHLRIFLPRVRFCPWRGGRLVPQRLHLSFACRSFDQPAAPLVLPRLQATNTLASQPAIGQLDRASWSLRKLRRENRLSLFCRGIAHRASFPRDLARIPLADGHRVLDLCFVPDRRDIY